MFTAAFARDLFERAVRTFAQALVSLWVVGDGFNLLHVDWTDSLGIAGGAAALSILVSIAAGVVGPESGASLGTTKPIAPDAP